MHKWMLFWAQARQEGPEEGINLGEFAVGCFPSQSQSRKCQFVTGILRFFQHWRCWWNIHCSQQMPCVLLLLSFTCHCHAMSAFTKITAFPISARVLSVLDNCGWMDSEQVKLRLPVQRWEFPLWLCCMLDTKWRNPLISPSDISNSSRQWWRTSVLWLLGCIQAAGESDSNLVQNAIKIFRTDCSHFFFIKSLNGIWLCSDWETLLTPLAGCCRDVGAEASSIIVWRHITTTVVLVVINAMEFGLNEAMNFEWVSTSVQGLLFSHFSVCSIIFSWRCTSNGALKWRIGSQVA